MNCIKTQAGMHIEGDNIGKGLSSMIQEHADQTAQKYFFHCQTIQSKFLLRVRRCLKCADWVHSNWASEPRGVGPYKYFLLAPLTDSFSLCLLIHSFH